MTLLERLLDFAGSTGWHLVGPALDVLPPPLRARVVARRLALGGSLLASRDLPLLPRHSAVLTVVDVDCDVPFDGPPCLASSSSPPETRQSASVVDGRWADLVAARLSGEHWAGWLESFAASSSRLDALSLPQVSLRDAHCLAAHVDGVRHLDLSRTSLHKDDLARLVRGLEDTLCSLAVSAVRQGDCAELETAMGKVDGRLRRLHVTGSRLGDGDLAWIRAAASRLETLSVRFNPGLTSEALCALVRNDLPSVRELSIGLIDNVDDDVADALADAPIRLCALDISRSSVSDDGLARLVRVQYRLERLNVTSCDGIGAAGVRAVAASLRDLRVLVLNFTDVDDDALAHVAASCRKLAVLRVSACHLVTDTGIGALHPLADSLCALSLGGGRISDDVIPHIARLTSLQALSLWSTAVSAAGVARLAATLDVAPPGDADGAILLGREPTQDADNGATGFIFDEIV